MSDTFEESPLFNQVPAQAPILTVVPKTSPEDVVAGIISDVEDMFLADGQSRTTACLIRDVASASVRLVLASEELGVKANKNRQLIIRQAEMYPDGQIG